MDFFLELETLCDRAVTAGVPLDEILSDLRAKVDALETETED